ncbi:MAG: PDZ domain-containing protein [Pyrinomonadaceae bacterium]
MNCKKCQREIDDAAKDQRISDEALAHVAACTPCRTFRTERITLREMVGQLGVVSAPSDFDFRLRARLAAEKSVRPSPVRRIFAPTSHAVAIAAAFVIIFAAAVVFKQWKPSSENVASSSAPASSKTSHRDAAIHNSQNDSLAASSEDTNSAHSVGRDSQTVASGLHTRELKHGKAYASQENERAASAAPKNSASFGATRADNVVLPPANANSNSAQSPENRLNESSDGLHEASTEPVTGTNSVRPTKRAASGPFAAYGIETVMLNAKDAARLGARGGVVVVAVHPETPASRSGLRTGDIIEQVDGRAFTGEEQSISSTAPITLGIVRDAQHLSNKLTSQSPDQK